MSFHFLGVMKGINGYINAAGGFRTVVEASPLTGRVISQQITRHLSDFIIEYFLAERFAQLEKPSEPDQIQSHFLRDSYSRNLSNRCKIAIVCSFYFSTKNHTSTAESFKIQMITIRKPISFLMVIPL